MFHSEVYLWLKNVSLPPNTKDGIGFFKWKWIKQFPFHVSLRKYIHGLEMSLCSRTKSTSQHKVLTYEQLDNIPNPVKIAKVKRDNSRSGRWMPSFCVGLCLTSAMSCCFCWQCFCEEITCEKLDPVLTTKGSQLIVQFDEHNRTNLYKFGVICQKFRQVNSLNTCN